MVNPTGSDSRIFRPGIGQLTETVKRLELVIQQQQIQIDRLIKENQKLKNEIRELKDRDSDTRSSENNQYETHEE